MTATGQIHLTDADRIAIAGIRGRASIRQFTREVCAEAGVEMRLVMGRNRTAPICRLREVIWHRAYAEGFSLSQIGRVFGRHHATILHGIRNERLRRGEAA